MDIHELNKNAWDQAVEEASNPIRFYMPSYYMVRAKKMG